MGHPLHLYFHHTIIKKRIDFSSGRQQKDRDREREVNKRGLLLHYIRVFDVNRHVPRFNERTNEQTREN